MVQSVLMEFKKLKRQKLTYVLLVALIIIITIDQFLIRMSTARYEGVVQYKHATTHFIEQLDPLATFLIVFIPLFVMGMFGFLFFDELHSSTVKYCLMRLNPTTYIKQRLNTILLTTFIGITCLLGGVLLFHMIFYPLDSQLVGQQMMYEGIVGRGLFDMNPWLYMIFLIFIMSLAACSISLFMIFISLWATSRGSLFAMGFTFIYVIPYVYKYGIGRLPLDDYTPLMMMIEPHTGVNATWEPIAYWGVLIGLLYGAILSQFRFRVKKGAV
ncbi:hypothetical protein [Dolosigranulum pigrum]|uniref:hypothetical protein n=1 Tax=Dolosigranulum pigrum TaxID=29394 RepID=UPI001AD85915|nr:hypothetical protein [Dolosigranulum pigrum]QTJ46071.1 hypothetical protein FE329_01505 [Dolosigranulum pigrum]QTJ59587.1 hypothetical protein FE337_01505 [Dolosigranulum pigrum]